MDKVHAAIVHGAHTALGLLLNLRDYRETQRSFSECLVRLLIAAAGPVPDAVNRQLSNAGH